MGHGRRIFVLALVCSLAVHLMLAGNAALWWQAPAEEIPFPIEAHLLEPAPRPDPLSSPPPRPTRQVAPTQPPVPEAPPAPTIEPHTETLPVVAPGPTAPPVEPDGRQLALEPAQASPAPADEIALSPLPSAPPARALRALPERLSLIYLVKTGGDGFNMGRSTYTWLAREGRYSLVSVTEATGITALFVSGKIVQTSEGQVVSTGLQPAQFWLTRGDRRQPPVHMDWQQGTLILPKSSVALPPLTQDLLSFPFHLAMTVRDDDGAWRVPVTNGKKLREYDFRVVGHESLERGETAMDTLHLQGNRPGEGSLDVWLAPAFHWLPARIRTQDPKGTTLVLELERVE